MKLHQALTGAANVFDDYVAVSSGLINGNPFISLGSGYDVVILDKDFHRVQIIPFPLDNATSIVRCLACSNDGKIAVSYGGRIVIFKAYFSPKSRENRLAYTWEQDACISKCDEVRRLCWDREGKRLLMGNKDIQMWKECPYTSEQNVSVVKPVWTCVWNRRLALPCRFLEFSPDGHYFASTGVEDRMVKIWYHSSKVEQATWRGRTRSSTESNFDEEVYNFIYILHPNVVTGISWRKTGPHMPPNCVPNVILTACADNISRLWIETVKQKPQHSSIVSVQRSVSGTQDRNWQSLSTRKDSKVSQGTGHDHYQAHHLISMFHFHLSAIINPVSDIALLSTIPTSSIFGRSFQLQWLDNKEIMFTSSMEEVLNCKKGDVPDPKDEEDSRSFSQDNDNFAVLEELDIDGDIEITEEGSTNGEGVESGTLETSEKESSSDGPSNMSSRSSPVPEKTPADQCRKGIKCTIADKISQLLYEWCKTGDTLFCIHPADGSLLIWLIDYLDDYNSAYYRQCQVSFASRIPNAFSKADANSLYFTRSYHIARVGNIVVSKIAGGHSSHSLSKASLLGTGLSKLSGPAGQSSASTQPDAYLLSAHSDGSINSWQLVFSDGLAFTGIASITHLRRNCGPRFETQLLVTHPTLPLTISTSKNHLASDILPGKERGLGKSCIVDDCSSELILWRSNFIGPLSQMGGMTETARISSVDRNKFNAVAWFPLLFEHSLLCINGMDGSSLLPSTPCAGFVGANKNTFELYQVILDAKTLLSYLTAQKHVPSSSISTEALSECIASEQSGSNSSCILKVCDLECPEKDLKVDFFHVFTNSSIHVSEDEKSLDNEENPLSPKSYAGKETCFVVAVVEKHSTVSNKKHHIYVWKIYMKTDDGPLPSPQSVTSDSSTSPASPTKSYIFKNAIFVHSLVEQELVLHQDLPLPSNTYATNFSAATDIATTLGHNSTCPSPYWFSVTCSDNIIRFFRCIKGTVSCVDHYSIHDYHMDIISNSHTEASVASILAIANATPYRLAWLATYEGLDSSKAKLIISESETSGGEKWNEEFSIDFDQCINESIRSADNVILSWMSLETDYCLLTLAVGRSLHIYHHEYTDRLPDIPTATLSTVAVPHWTLLASVDLCVGTRDRCKMTSLAWAWDGMLLVGVKNELRVYSQWESDGPATSISSLFEVIGKDKQEDTAVSGSTFQRAAKSLSPLPQYHPKHLIEMLNLGKSRRVKAILSNLVRCVAGREAADAAAEAGDVIRGRTRTFSRTFSTHSVGPPDGKQGLLDASEVLSDVLVIPPLPLNALFAADQDESGNIEGINDDIEIKEESTDYSTLFERQAPGSITSFDESISKTLQGTGMSKSAVYFGLAQSHLLAQHLSRTQLPGLSRMDQLYLLALSDTVASTKEDLEGNSIQERGIQFARRESQSGDALSHWGGGGGYATTGSIGATAGSGGDAVDECGLKFLLAMRHHTTLQKSLPPAQQAVLNLKGLPSAKFAWAFHSDCEEELLAMVPGMLRGEPHWKDLKQHGVVWWIKSTETLKRMAEKIAKAHFQVNQNPLDCAIFYLAMKKKTLLGGLYRSLRDTKMSTFFSHDFTEERWRKAAMKNAYALLGMQRFEHAAAFFLLASALWDATQICISHLHDIQLALLIASLFEGPDAPIYRKILTEHILGEGNDEPHPDPFLRSIAYWRLKNYNEALETLLLDPSNRTSVTGDRARFNQMAAMGHPDIFNYYVFLRTHPVLRRRHFHRHDTLTDLGGFKYKEKYIKSPPQSQEVSLSAVVMHNNPTTPRERKLYFLTACAHLKAGMPDLALEVLMLLPKELEKEDSLEQGDTHDSLKEATLTKEAERTEDMIITGTLQENSSFDNSTGKNDFANKIDWSKPVSSSAFDWSTPVSLQTSDSFDWSQPVSQKAEEFNWGTPIGLSSLQNNMDATEGSGSSRLPKVLLNGDAGNFTSSIENDKLKGEDESPPSSQTRKRDIVGLHLKYVAILKCLVEELRSLPQKCQAERTKLRPTVADLLEREVALLHQLCDYNSVEGGENVAKFVSGEEGSQSLPSANTYQDGSHDLSVDKNTLAQKAEKVTKQIQWLGRNQRILTTLYNCCSTQGVGGENLPAICLELLLLLHELEHHHVLAAPLRAFSAGPSAPPLLLASMATFSMVASPVSYLQSMTHDILRSLYAMQCLPTASAPAPSLTALESLALSLSSCLYHSLCGGQDDHVVEGIRRGELILLGKQNKEGRMVKLGQSSLADGIDKILTEPSSAPSSWPGVHYLRSILAVSNKEISTNLKVLLCEAAVAVYISLLVSASSRAFVDQLYRLVQNCLSGDMWGRVFGGGTNVVLSFGGSRDRIDDKKKFDTARMKWNYRLLGKRASVPSSNEPVAFQQELFITPVITLYDFFQKKPTTITYDPYEYDSEDSIASSEDEEYEESDPEFDDDFDASDIKKKPQEPKDHLDCNSYSWLLMRFGILKVAFSSIQSFVTSAGIELSDLPSQSPLLYATLKMLIKWQQHVMVKLDNEPDPPVDYIPVYYSNMGDGVARGGVTLQRFKALLDPKNTPFRSTSHKAYPAKRLWYALVHQECLKQTFLYYAFSRGADIVEQDQTDFHAAGKPKTIYRDQDPISCFCFNGANFNTLALATTREIIEVDIAPLLQQDVLTLRDEIAAVGRSASTISIDVDDETLLVSRHSDNVAVPNILMKKNQAGVRRMDSHPNLPYYITGATDGSVKLWEFGHNDQIALYRQAGVHDRVTRVHFNSLGNKFGVTDDSGYLSLWLMSNTPKPFLTQKCHTRQALDFAFVGSTSLIATAGYSSEGRNICLWDTLLPMRRSLVHAFTHHENGAQSILYMPGQQCILSGGRKGNICIFDIRQRRLLHMFSAHDSAIKSLALEPREQFFASGFADGDIKIWGIGVHELYNTFTKEHTRSAYLRNMSTGVQSLTVLSNCQLFSCGSDGTLKWRSLNINENDAP